MSLIDKRSPLPYYEQLAELLRRVEKGMVTRTFTVPEQRLDLVSLLHDAGRVVQESASKGKTRLKVIGFKPALARARAKVDAALRG